MGLAAAAAAPTVLYNMKRVLKPAARTAQTLLARRFGELLPSTSLQAGPTCADHTTAAATTEVPVYKTVQDLQGPKTLPLVGNFWVYVKKENRGRLHEVQVSGHCCCYFCCCCWIVVVSG